MAKIDIDNVKMWESIMKYQAQYGECWGDIFDDALSEQGLEFKDGHIVSIQEQNADFKIEKGKWYVCTKEYFLQCEGEYDFLFEKGKIYKTYVDDQGGEWITADNGHSYIFDYSAYFRPATEEEIRGNSPKISPNSPAPKRDNYDEIKQAEPEQENSPILKELERNGKDELTEIDGIQKIIYDLLSSTNGEWLEEEYLTEMSKNISEDIRKQIVESIDVDYMDDHHNATMLESSALRELAHARYRQGIEDVLDKIKEEQDMTKIYECQECGEIFEVEEKYPWATLTECPKCGEVIYKS